MRGSEMCTALTNPRVVLQRPRRMATRLGVVTYLHDRKPNKAKKVELPFSRKKSVFFLFFARKDTRDVWSVVQGLETNTAATPLLFAPR